MARTRDDSRNIYPVVGVGIGILLLFVAWITELAGPRTAPISYAIFAAGILIAVASALHFRVELMRILKSRSTTMGALVALSVLLVIGIAVVLNIFAARRLDRQYDYTKEKYFTLAEQSIRVLGMLNHPVHVLGFFTNDPSDFRYRDRLQAEELLQLYERESRGKVTYELVDPYRDPQIAATYSVDFESLTIFEMGERRESTATVSETEFTAAFLKLALNKSPVIYFVTGHEERDIEDFSLLGLRDVAESLQKQNYLVRPLALAQQSPVRVPDDAAVVVVASPRVPLDAPEITALDSYARRGGRLFLMFDPPSTELEAMTRWLKRWGVVVGDDIVIDLLANFDSSTIPVGRYGTHRITQSLRRQRRDIPVRYACSVRASEKLLPGITIETLMQTSDSDTACWAEIDMTTYPPRLDPQDTPGPITFAVAVAQQLESDAGEGARMVIVGDSDFATNDLAQRGGDFFLNAIHWLTLQEDLIAIPPRDPSDRRLNPAITAAEHYTLLIVTMGLMPAVFALLGVGVWIRRR